MFLNNKLKRLQQEQDTIFRYFRVGDKIQEIEDYFNIYVFLMRKHIGDLDNQILCSSVFAKLLMSFDKEETAHLSQNQIEDMQYAGKKMLIDLRNGYPSESNF